MGDGPTRVYNTIALVMQPSKKELGCERKETK